ncbi:response regulator [Candidatus Woesearchaeota archaeon]|nr:response regulator [Candidatus Woesearchaeota archaeon]
MTLNVVVVDDSAFMRSLLKNLITQAGGQIVGEAADGIEAVERFDQLKPNLVFMDIMMPNKNGLEALRDIIKMDGNAKVVMCTSVGQDKVVAEAVDAGASDFIVKPFKPDDIKAVIEKYTS